MRRSTARRSDSTARAVEARFIVSRRVSRVSIPSRARRMSDWRSCSERARRNLFSDNDDRDFVGNDFGGDDGGENCLTGGS